MGLNGHHEILDNYSNLLLHSPTRLIQNARNAGLGILASAATDKSLQVGLYPPLVATHETAICILICAQACRRVGAGRSGTELRTAR